MGNTDNSKSKKCRRRIKIRLVDPNILDSYVCEILDSSLENEEEIPKNVEDVHQKKEDSSKAKNNFELLNAKEHKRNNDSSQGSEMTNIITHDNLFEETKHEKKESKKFLEDKKTKKKNKKVETDSSEDESLVQIEKKFNLKILNGQVENKSILDLPKEKEIKNGEIFAVFESQKTEITQKKTLSILNYFSKTETTLKKNDFAKKINTLRNSIKTSQENKCRKSFKKTNLGKTCVNETKISLNGINKENFKLAPLFCKKENKIIDSAKQKARLEFLFGGSSSVLKKSDYKISDSVFNFPTVSHIQQRNDSVCWSLRTVFLPLPEVHHSGDSEFNCNKIFRLKINKLNNAHNSVVDSEIKINDEFMCKIKWKYLGLNLDIIIDGLKEKRDKFLAQTVEISKSQKETNAGFEELNMLFTEKYKPSSSEILGNGNVVKKLKNWLQSWKTYDEELKVLAKSVRNSKHKNKSDDESDDDDFLDSGSENYGLKAPGNVCVISGPNGCGKTALVYALANELEFGVLELNSSSKRTGKKVISDLQEATQSHKVHRVNLLQTEMEFKKKKGRRKKKNKKESIKILDQTNDCKISLILIEDADIVFDEHDDGFFSAIFSLVQTSKRPLIFLTNESNCHHLYNLKPEQCLLLEMEPPNFYKSCAILDIVSSLEGSIFDKGFLESLFRQCNFDLRKSFMQLQFWIPSQNFINFDRGFDLGHLWWGLSKFLYKQDTRHFVKPKNRKRKRTNELFDSSEDEMKTTTKKFKPDLENSKNCSSVNASVNFSKTDSSIDSYFRVLDVASALDGFSLSGSQEPIPGLERKLKDSLSLGENMEEVSWNRKTLTDQLVNELVTLSTKIFSSRESSDGELNFIPPCWDEIRWRNSQKKASEELCALISLQRGRDERSLYLDYLPILRDICRMERNRMELNPKRKNRFFHYLSNLGLELTDENLEINCDVFGR